MAADEAKNESEGQLKMLSGVQMVSPPASMIASRIAWQMKVVTKTALVCARNMIRGGTFI